MFGHYIFQILRSIKSDTFGDSWGFSTPALLVSEVENVKWVKQRRGKGLLLLTFLSLVFVTSWRVQICWQFLLVNMLLFEAPLPAALSPPLSDKVLDSRPRPGVHHVAPVSGGPHRQLLESLHQQNTGVTDFTPPAFWELEASLEMFFILQTGGEPEK